VKPAPVLHNRPSLTVETIPGDANAVGVTDEGLGNTAWVVPFGAGVIVVDPPRDPSPLLEVADQLGRRVELVAETHLHADFLSGAPALADRGAAALVPESARSTWPHEAIAPGQSIANGQWRLRALATPGHTPEHLSYVITDGGRPRVVLTGGSLLVGAVARTDLIDPADTVALTKALWRSIHHELLALPDDVLVLPTHGAGSFCSAPGGGRRWTTIGDERRSNPLLQHDDEGSFVEAVLGALGTYPPYFLRLRERNRLGVRLLPSVPTPALDPNHVEFLRRGGATVVDVRSVADYAAGHIAGSLANTLRPQFASWLGWLVDDPSRPLVFVTDDNTDRRELVRQCLNIGFEAIAGEIRFEAWRADGREVATTPLLSADATGGRVTVDVRQANEFSAGHVPDAIHLELGAVAAASTLPSSPLLVMCGHGERAASAASLLESRGRTDVAILDGGPTEWMATHGHPLAK
jgi:hydroxyacylglutathione hydrolase